MVVYFRPVPAPSRRGKIRMPPDKNTVLVNESFVRSFGVGDLVGLTVGEAVAKNRPG